VPPAPEQDKVKELLPAVEIVTTSLPEVAFVPDQVPEAEQEVALEVDQVRVEVFVKRTDVGSADKLTVGAGVTGAGVTGAAGALPPPPQDDKNKTKANIDLLFIH
tara:strand:+ start:427 stop:741 length:315 start_codon:yes stop_codon:yes gene_type:complete